MSTIVQNQQRAYVARSQDAARRLADELKALSPAQQAAILATVTAALGLPIDHLMLTDEHEDGPEAAALLDGVLLRNHDEQYAWHINGDCLLRIIPLRKALHRV